MENIIGVKNVGKKFCKSLKRSMIYGMQDILTNIIGVVSNSSILRDGEFWAVNNVSFDIRQGETIGIIGPNGSGKSTMLKMLNGIYMPDFGEIIFKGRVGALIEVGAGFHPMLTGRENIYINGAILGMSKSEIDSKFDRIVEFAGIEDFLEVSVKHYSSGMYVRLGFAIAVHCEPDILLVDEVLAVGDTGFQNRCFDKIGELKRKNTTTILVSHSMHAISAFADRVILFKKGIACCYDDAGEGIKGYNDLFSPKADFRIERVCSGNDEISFVNVSLGSQELTPPAHFEIILEYEAKKNLEDVEIDTAMTNLGEIKPHFQANNKAYNQQINFKKGRHLFKIVIENIQLNNTSAKLGIAIFEKQRKSTLFWWKVPISFSGKLYANGSNFFNVTYQNC